MTSPRLAFACGVAGVAGAALLLTGRVEGSVVTVVALTVAGRSAAVAASPEVPGGARVLGRHLALVPAWVGIAVIATMRAGSDRLSDIRGANAVVGPAIARGNVFFVAAAWCAVLAAAVAIAAPGVAAKVNGRSDGRGLDSIAAFAQIALVVTFFAGPQVTRAGDVVPWIVGFVVVVAAVVGAAVAERAVRVDRFVHAASGLAALGVALVLVGGHA